MDPAPDPTLNLRRPLCGVVDPKLFFSGLDKHDIKKILKVSSKIKLN
jgi:hypothetical protein